MTDLPTQSHAKGTPEADSSHTPTPRGTPVCRCQKHQGVATAHALREAANGDPARLMDYRVNVLAAHIERYHPELTSTERAAEEAEYRGILEL